LYAWNQLGRKVKKGEKGIRILAPIIGIKRKRDEEAEKDITKQNTTVLVGFRNAYVFDRLSRDLRPEPLRDRRIPPVDVLLGSGAHIIAQLLGPVQRSLTQEVPDIRAKVNTGLRINGVPKCQLTL
jgi:hypothetical protein